MTTARKIISNRANAKASTGPKTLRGKARAVRNARRHGLSRSVISDPVLSEQIEAFTREIAGEAPNNEIYQLARRIAEAQVGLIRIRHARHDSFVRDLNDPDYVSFEGAKRVVEFLRKFITMYGPDAVFSPEMMELIESTKPQGVQKSFIVFSDLTKQLMLMDRYEDRALSRRKFAIRAFDLARRDAIKSQLDPPE